MFGKFDDQIAVKEPNLITREYGILIKKMKDTNRERNRVLMMTDFANGNPYAQALRHMQNDILPSVNTPIVKIEYEIEAQVCHDAMFSSGQEVPSIKIPIYITLDPQGAIDTGMEGHMISQEKRQLDQALKDSQVSLD